jgi:hypothetical protein
MRDCIIKKATEGHITAIEYSVEKNKKESCA